ncbi:MAG: DUF1176 domain-containing protein [Rhodothermaceae bacterium]|nr:DUF1176 domain-containing protein [Rhodothermaceae bacterium]
MRTLLPLLLLTACAQDPAPEATPAVDQAPVAPSSAPAESEGADFDARAWLDQTRPLVEAYDTANDPDAAREAIKQQADLLDDALDWRRACDTYWDPTTNAEVYDPLPREDEDFGRGMLYLDPLGEGRTLVTVTCYFGAYQGSYALVHIEGDRAMLVRAPDLDENDQPTDRRTGVFGTPEVVNPAQGIFETFSKGRGLGDCGTFVRYRLAEGGRTDIREVRSRGCNDDLPKDLPPPHEWPVVYRADG